MFQLKSLRAEAVAPFQYVRVTNLQRKFTFRSCALQRRFRNGEDGHFVSLAVDDVAAHAKSAVQFLHNVYERVRAAASARQALPESLNLRVIPFALSAIGNSHFNTNDCALFL